MITPRNRLISTSMGCIVSKKVNLSSERKYYSFNGYADQEESTARAEEEEIPKGSQRKQIVRDCLKISEAESKNGVNCIADETSSRSVHENITKFEQLNKESTLTPMLRSINKVVLDPSSRMFTNVSFFENMDESDRPGHRKTVSTEGVYEEITNNKAGE